jgi:hypothetical protein
MDGRIVEMKDLTQKEFAALGGKARSKKMTAKERSESARSAAKARWGEKKKKAKA